MIISHSRKFIFIHLEKCGGTSVETALQPYLAWDDLILGSTDFGESLQSLYINRYGEDAVKNNMLWKHSSANQIYNYLGARRWNKYKKISVVRNPFDLMRSLYAYSHTVVKYHIGYIGKSRWEEMIRQDSFPNSWPYTEPYVRALGQSVVEETGINGFAKHLLDSNSEVTKSQMSRILPSLMAKDLGLIIDLSQISDRWQEVLNVASISDSVPLDRLNASEYTNHEEFNSSTTRRIQKHFAADFEFLPTITGAKW